MTGVINCVVYSISSAAVNGQIPTVSVLPEVLWGTGGDVSRNIVETAVTQLYCSGSGATIVGITWSKDGTTLTNDPPHLRIRGSSTDMSVLTIDNFNSSDDGQYVCHVSGNTGSATSPILTLTGMYIDGNVGYQWCTLKVLHCHRLAYGLLISYHSIKPVL